MISLTPLYVARAHVITIQTTDMDKPQVMLSLLENIKALLTFYYNTLIALDAKLKELNAIIVIIQRIPGSIDLAN